MKQTETLLVCCSYGFNIILMISNEYSSWFIAYPMVCSNSIVLIATYAMLKCNEMMS